MDGPGAQNETLRHTPVSVDAATLHAAAHGFHNNFPARSAKRVFYWTQIIALGLLGYGVWRALTLDAGLTWGIVHAAAFALFTAAIAWRLFAAAQLTPLLSRLAAPALWPTYTILCPLYREANVVADLVAALERIDYPADALDIKLLVEADDDDTLAAAIAATIGRPHIEIIAIPFENPRTKPKALNVGLSRARGEFLAVYDAEDRPHPQQLRAALAAFTENDALACVQAPLAIDNADASWIARQFAAEYAIQFRQILPLLAQFGLPLPLGGTSNHFRVDALRAIGGWDPNNVSEDRAIFASKLNRFRTRAFHIPFVSQSCASAA